MEDVHDVINGRHVPFSACCKLSCNTDTKSITLLDVFLPTSFIAGVSPEQLERGLTAITGGLATDYIACGARVERNGAKNVRDEISRLVSLSSIATLPRVPALT